MPLIGRFHQPYRGEIRPKMRGHPSPAKPIQNSVDKVFWFIFIVIGVIIFGSALTYLLTKHNLGGFFIFAIYLIFLLIAIFAFQDAKQIKTITLDDPPVDKKDSALLDDYLAQIEWKQNHRRNHPQEPKWRYHPVSAKSRPKDFGFFIALLVMIPIFILAYFYGAKSLVTTISAIVLGIVAMLAFLIYQDSRN